MGRISPKSSSRNVTSTVLKRNSKRAKCHSELITFDESITIQILTRLFVTRIVANRRSTFDSSETISPSRESELCDMRCSSLGVSEKNATSDPETRADMVSRINVRTSITPTSGVKPRYMTAVESKNSNI